MREELQAMESNNTWSIVPLPIGKHQLVVVGSTSLSTNQMVLWSDIKLVSWLSDTPNVRVLI